MQAIKEKLSDMSAMRQAKAEAKEDEKAQKELAKKRVEVAHEVRMAREAEAAMDLHVNKAVEKAAEADRKYHHPTHGGDDAYGRHPNSPNTAGAGYTTDPMSGGAGPIDPAAGYGGDTGDINSAAARAHGSPPYNNLL